ncbi:hypothetical protein SAMN06296273_2666 [Nitrosomonas ureae]|uniref:Uncharacterized protein n=1 Tax=Nitrosomonas ureae TaxID=44577 RepID=A0A285C2D6_9PROT|nr:hypothetical protein [Nitrosomonas ureae]SNX61213.1 hypothetical protein SAMN06296273_2666 [Nitrosomonas ureae]
MPVTIDMKGIELIPTPKIKLANIEDCRREMARVYRDARTARIDSQDASRFVYILSQIGKMIELSDIEKRLELLERQNNDQY